MSTLDTTGDNLFLLSCLQNGGAYGTTDTYPALSELDSGAKANHATTYTPLIAQGSDLAYASGVYYDTSYNAGGWWLRAGCYHTSNYVCNVNIIGFVSNDYATSDTLGARVAFVIATGTTD